MKKTKMFIVLDIYGDQLARLYADKWAANRARNVLIKAGDARSEILIFPVVLGSSAERLGMKKNNK